MKSKLQLIMVFCAFLGASFFSFNVVSVDTASAARDARGTCSNPAKTGGVQLSGSNLEACIVGYNGGYDSKPLNIACGTAQNPASKHINYGTGGNLSVCEGGYSLGVAQRKADGGGGSSPSLDDRAKAACDNMGSQRAEHCIRGYKAASAQGATTKTANAECNKTTVNGERTDELDRDDCRVGIDRANRDGIEVDEGRRSNDEQGRAQTTAKGQCEDKGFKGEELTVCTRSFREGKEGKTKEEACGNVKQSNKDACEWGWAKGAGTNDEDNNDNPNCDLKFTSPLSWIVCPIVDMGTAFTDFIYGTFVRGLLEDVPVNPDDPKDGSTNAWKQFRILGNILLVGTLLMIVYSQARGGGGGR